MESLFILWVLICVLAVGVLLVGLICTIAGHDKFVTLITVIFGIVWSFAGMMIAASVFRDGSPSIHELGLGTHKVGFVYATGATVSVGIEIQKWQAEEKTENLKFYQLPRDYFPEKEINSRAKQLKVWTTRDGRYRRYSLD